MFFFAGTRRGCVTRLVRYVQGSVFLARLCRIDLKKENFCPKHNKLKKTITKQAKFQLSLDYCLTLVLTRIVHILTQNRAICAARFEYSLWSLCVVSAHCVVLPLHLLTGCFLTGIGMTMCAAMMTSSSSASSLDRTSSWKSMWRVY